MRIRKGSTRMIHESESACSSCYYWKSGEALETEGYTGALDDRGFCLRYPPGWPTHDKDRLPIAEQPMTGANDTCGEHVCYRDREKGGDVKT